MAEEKKMLSQRAFAKHIGVSEGAIRKAINESQITFGYDVSTKKFDVKKAEENAWVQKQILNQNKRLSAKDLMAEFDKEVSAMGEDLNQPIEDISVVELLSKIKVHSGLKHSEAMRLRSAFAFMTRSYRFLIFTRLLLGQIGFCLSGEAPCLALDGCVSHRRLRIAGLIQQRPRDIYELGFHVGQVISQIGRAGLGGIGDDLIDKTVRHSLAGCHPGLVIHPL